MTRSYQGISAQLICGYDPSTQVNYVAWVQEERGIERIRTVHHNSIEQAWAAFCLCADAQQQEINEPARHI